MFHTERLFSLIDLDGDGELTQSEFIGVRISRKTIPKIKKNPTEYLDDVTAGLCPGQRSAG